MPSKDDIALRPRFKFGINKDNEVILEAFEQAKSNQSLFILTRIDNHVFIRFSNEKQNFWSPQLHLNINKIDENSSIVSGLIGPNPTVWTLFMFLHFMVAGLFIAFGIWTYTNIRLSNSYSIQICFMLLTIIMWFLLYFIGRLGKASCGNEIEKLSEFMHGVLNKTNKPQTETDLELRLN